MPLMKQKKIYILLTRTKTVVSRTIHLATGDSFTHVSAAFDGALESLCSFGRLKPFLPPCPRGLCGRAWTAGISGGIRMWTACSAPSPSAIRLIKPPGIRLPPCCAIGRTIHTVFGALPCAALVLRKAARGIIFAPSLFLSSLKAPGRSCFQSLPLLCARRILRSFPVCAACTEGKYPAFSTGRAASAGAPGLWATPG